MWDPRCQQESLPAATESLLWPEGVHGHLATFALLTANQNSKACRRPRASRKKTRFFTNHFVETITGSNERKGSEMPMDPPQNTPLPVRAEAQRTPARRLHRTWRGTNLCRGSSNIGEPPVVHRGRMPGYPSGPRRTPFLCRRSSMAELLFCKEPVVGSIPTVGSNLSQARLAWECVHGVFPSAHELFRGRGVFWARRLNFLLIPQATLCKPL